MSPMTPAPTAESHLRNVLQAVQGKPGQRIVYLSAEISDCVGLA